MRFRLLFSLDKNRFNKEIKEIKENCKEEENKIIYFFLLDLFDLLVKTLPD